MNQGVFFDGINSAFLWQASKIPRGKVGVIIINP